MTIFMTLQQDCLQAMKSAHFTQNTYTFSRLIRVRLLTFNPFPNKPWRLRVCSTSLLKTLREKEKLLVTSSFSFSHSVFYPLGERSTILIKFKSFVCKLLVWKSLKFVVWERVKRNDPSVLIIDSKKQQRKVSVLLQLRKYIDVNNDHCKHTTYIMVAGSDRRKGMTT